VKAFITFPHSFFVKKVAGVPLITRIIKVLQQQGIHDVFIMSNILDLDKDNAIQIIKKKEEIEEKIGQHYLLIDVPVVFDQTFITNLLKEKKTGIISFSKIKEKEYLGVFNLITHHQDLKKSEKLLLKSLRKPHDTLISRTLNRPVSLFFSKFLMHTKITPNIITVFVFLIGVLASAVLLLKPDYWGGVLGGVLFHLSSVLDGCDGEIARLKFQGSKLGVWLDNISDDFTNLLFAGALGYYSFVFKNNSLYLWVGFVGMAMFFIAKTIQYIMIFKKLQKEDIAQYEFEITKKPAQGFKKVFQGLFIIGSHVARNDFMAFALMIGSFFGILHIGTWIVAGFMTLLSISVIINALKILFFSKK